ncbi:MAG TPA: NOL1/NOP2/sun family putative RNA methylase [Archaeoglobus sp.]|nr:NOL1/NOP2/sun family putative RNA methylase [Archaeoglobus sp.]
MIYDFPSTKFSIKLAKKYGYDEFIVRRWLNFFKDDAIKIIEKFERGIPRYLRINTIKISEDLLVHRLEKRGFKLEKTEVEYCYKILREPYSAGATPEFLLGYYYLMDKSSCIPPLVLDPKPGEIVVDLAASPGGKTTFISMLMENKGVVVAVEPQVDRINALIDNIHRMGVINVVVMKMDGRDLPKINIKPDKILLDAPCTGEGIIHKDPSRKTDRGSSDIEFCAKLQKQLIISAFDSLKSGGELVYCTCSMTPEENELVVDYLIQNRDCKLLDIKFGVEPLILPELQNPKEVKKARRIFPHIHESSGFFIAKIKKI